MPLGTTMKLPQAPDVTAPDGSAVRILLARQAGSMAHFQLAANEVSRAVRHRTVEEIWFVLSGSGEMWQSDDHSAEVFTLAPGTCLTIPVGTRFQFRARGDEPLAAVAITMPPWPGNDEAEMVDGTWTPTAGDPG